MKYFAALFAIFIVVVIVLADGGHLGFLSFVYDFPYGDKVGHFTLFGILSLLLNMAALFPRRFANHTRIVVFVSFLLALVIVLEEWSQNFFPNRTPDWLDMGCSYLGVALGAWLAWKLAQKGK